MDKELNNNILTALIKAVIIYHDQRGETTSVIAEKMSLSEGLILKIVTKAREEYGYRDEV